MVWGDVWSMRGSEGVRGRPFSQEGAQEGDPLRKELRRGTPCEKTNTCENITFPHTPHAVDKNYRCISIIHYSNTCSTTKLANLLYPSIYSHLTRK